MFGQQNDRLSTNKKRVNLVKSFKSSFKYVAMRNYRPEKSTLSATNKPTHKLSFKQIMHISAANFKSLVFNYKGMDFSNTL